MTSDVTFHTQNPIDSNRLAQLRAAAGAGPVLILPHNNPDPDALASGKALATLLRRAWGIPARLLYSGLIARAENRVMLDSLTPEWELTETLTDLEQYSALALVDTQPGAGNNSLPDSYTPHIVIDHHHPIREGLQVVSYADMRPEVGATVSLVYQHLEAGEIEPDAILATAMFYGLKTDTCGLSRGASPIDEAIYINLLARLDRHKLIQVEQAGLPRIYFRAFNRGLQATRLYGQSLIAHLGPMHRPDLMAEMADLLIRLEGAHAALCLGHYGGTLYLSLRTASSRQDAGLLIQDIVSPPSKAGGHGRIAGGQIPLTGQDLEVVVADIKRRYLAVMGETGVGVPLLEDA